MNKLKTALIQKNVFPSCISQQLHHLTIAAIFAICFITLVSCIQTNSITKKLTKSEEAMQNAIELLDEKKYQEAIAMLSRSLELDSNNYGAYVNRAYAYENINDLDKATTDLEHALATSSTPQEITYFNLGNVYYKQSRFTDAIVAYTNALQYNPRYRGAFLNRANSYLSIKSYEAAISDYEIFLQLLNDKESRPEVVQMINLLKEMLNK